MLFLIDYDRGAGKIVALRTFDESQRRTAMDARLELELDLRRQGIEREVVLLEAADEKAIRKTHRRYFADLAELAKIPEMEKPAN
ncbi:MAG TPA: hypothetical protein VHD56_06820 [Tepidisphaeraceae bacterium]|nr:hypothetical protein [Tepidisphaeraceae bacterium]